MERVIVAFAGAQNGRRIKEILERWGAAACLLCTSADQVRRAVAPCGDLRFADRVYPVFGDQEFYREYHDFFQYLERSGTELIRSADCAGRTFAFGDYGLECLYPLRDSTQRSVAYIDHNTLQCGFENANYFSRKFREVYGVTPGEFRRRALSAAEN